MVCFFSIWSRSPVRRARLVGSVSKPGFVSRFNSPEMASDGIGSNSKASAAVPLAGNAPALPPEGATTFRAFGPGADFSSLLHERTERSSKDIVSRRATRDPPIMSPLSWLVGADVPIANIIPNRDDVFCLTSSKISFGGIP